MLITDTSFTKISLTTGVDSGIFPDSNTIPGWILNCSNLQTNDTHIYLYIYISGMFRTNVKLMLDAIWYFFLHGVWSALYKWFQCQSDWTGCEMCQRSFRPQRQILSLIFIWHTACVIWSSKLGMLQKESIMEEVSNKLRGSHLKGQVGSSFSSLIWCV